MLLQVFGGGQSRDTYNGGNVIAETAVAVEKSGVKLYRRMCELVGDYAVHSDM